MPAPKPTPPPDVISFDDLPDVIPFGELPTGTPTPTPLSSLPVAPNAPAPTPGPGSIESGAPIDIRGSAGGIGATLGVGLAGLTGPIGWLTGAAFATIGGGLGEAFGQMSDLSRNLEAEKDRLHGREMGLPPTNSPDPAPGAPRSGGGSLRGIAAEGLTQGAFEAVTGGTGALLKRGVSGVPKVAVKAAEGSAAGRTYRAAQQAATHEAKVLESEATLAALNEAADGAIDAMKALEGQEFRVQRAQNAQYLLRQRTIEISEKAALGAQESAKGYTADMTAIGEQFTRDVKRFLPAKGPMVKASLSPKFLEYLHEAEKAIATKKPVAEFVSDKAHGRVLRLGNKEVAAAAEEVPLDSLIYGISALKKAIDEGVKGGMDRAETALLRSHLREWQGTATRAFAEIGDPARAAAWRTFLNVYGSEKQLMKTAMMKIADVSPAKLAGLIDDNPATVRTIREMAATVSPKAGPNAKLVSDVREAFMEEIVRGKDGVVRLEKLNSKLKGYGESVPELFRDDMASLQRWRDMGRQAEDLLAEAAKKPAVPPPATLMQRAWEVATSRTVVGGLGSVAGGAHGFLEGGLGGGVLGASLAGGASAVASEVLPVAVLQKIAQDPAAYSRWVASFEAAGRGSEAAINALASVIRVKLPGAIGPIRSEMRRAAGAEPRPLPRPSPSPSR